jgi:hypothetical protein
MTRRWPYVVAGIAGVVALATLLVALAADDVIERRLRSATIELLRERFQSEVDLGSVDVQLLPSLRATFGAITLRHQGRRDIPPLVSIRALTIQGDVWSLWLGRVDRVHLDGLDIVIPPRRREDMPKPAETNAGGKGNGPHLVIGELVSEDARLAIMPKQADKHTREFRIHLLRMSELDFSKATPFEASLTNPKPEGLIAATGAFGPWHADEPSRTPVRGTFTFAADLGTIKGLGGKLDAEGTFSGPLERIESTGRTTTPDFRLSSLDAHALPLATSYAAVIDGTNGDVILEKVEARLGESVFHTQGSIVDVKGVKGRYIHLTASSTAAELTDVLRLVMSGDAVMAGRLDFDARIDLPPGEPDVIDRLALDGQFRVAGASFTSRSAQEKVDELARRSQGRPNDSTVDNVASDFRGRFQLKAAVLGLGSLTFAVEGADVALAGRYHLKSEALDFRGDLRLRAPVSETTTGFRSILLMPFDPLLRKRGTGTRLAIRVTGTREKPEFGIEWGRTLKGK